MKSGWLRGSLPKHQNQLGSDGKRRHFSRIEDRLRHRKQQFQRKVDVFKEETSSGNDFKNSRALLEEKSGSELHQDQVETPSSNKNSEKTELPEMTHRAPRYRRPKDIWKIVSENKTRNQSPHFPVVRPQSAPCNLLFKIKCAKQVKSVKILDEGRSFSDEKFETRSTRSACSTSRSQDNQFTIPLWPKGIGESLQNKSFESEKPTQDFNVIDDNGKNKSGTKSPTELKIFDQDYGKGKNYEEMFKNIPQECPEIYRKSDRQLESSHGDMLQFSDYQKDLISRHLILKGCEDDFSDGPLSSPERTTNETRFKWDTVLTKKNLLSPRNNASRVLGKSPKGHSCLQSCFSEDINSSFAITRPRSEHLGLKCCPYTRCHHCNCPDQPMDWKTFELCFKKENEKNKDNIENTIETIDSEKITNATATVLKEDAACSPRRLSYCDLDIQVSENDHFFEPEDQTPKTTRSVSIQVDDLIISARDIHKIEQNNPCQDSFRSSSDDHCNSEEISQTLRCAKCKKIFENENNHQDCHRCLADKKRCQLDCNKNSIIEQDTNCNCQSEELHANGNTFQNQERILNHCPKNEIKSCGHTLMRNDLCYPGTIAKINHCCCVNCVDNNGCENIPQHTYFESRNPSTHYSKLTFCKKDQQPGESHFCCKRANEMCFCMPKISSNSRKVSFCCSSGNSHKTPREISSQTVFRPYLQNGKNYFDDGSEERSFKRRDASERKLHGNKLHSKAESLSPPKTGRSIPNKLFPHKTGDDHRMFFCNEIVNKQQDILRSCMRNQPEENKARFSAFRTPEYSNSDNEWSASPEEDISGQEVIFPKETRHAINYLRQARETLPRKRHLKRVPRGQTLKEENGDEVDQNIDENESSYTSAYAKALAVFQKGSIPPVPTDFKKIRNHIQQNVIGGK